VHTWAVLGHACTANIQGHGPTPQLFPTTVRLISNILALHKLLAGRAGTHLRLHTMYAWLPACTHASHMHVPGCLQATSLAKARRVPAYTDEGELLPQVRIHQQAQEAIPCALHAASSKMQPWEPVMAPGACEARVLPYQKHGRTSIIYCTYQHSNIAVLVQTRSVQQYTV
jgi:hypothetical protein